SPFANAFTAWSPRPMPSRAAMRSPSSMLVRPANTIRRLESSRSIAFEIGWVETSGIGAPFRCAVGCGTGSGLGTIPDPVLVVLPRARDPERPGRDVVRDDRPGGGHRSVTNPNRSDEDAIAARLDVCADLRAVFAETVVVCRDVAGPDVGSLADRGVADVREVRDLRPPADPRALHLHVGADLGAVLELHPGAEVGGGAHLAAGAAARRGGVRVADAAALADRDVDRDDLRTDLAAVADRGRPTQDRPGPDHRVPADRHVGVEPDGP